MNPPSSKHTIPLAAIAVILSVLAVLPHMDAMFFADAHYSECSDLVKSDPQAALQAAQAWRKQFPDSLLGRHCEALALFATRNYNQAAEKFMELAKHVSTTNRLLSSRLYRQADEAYMAAGKPDKAKEAAEAALVVYAKGAPAPQQPTQQPTDTTKKDQPAGPATPPAASPK